MYLDDLAATIRRHIPPEHMLQDDIEDLLVMYAVLARSKGGKVTQSDVHDAWAAWMSKRDCSHAALVPYGELTSEAREEDRVFAAAVRMAAEEAGLANGSRATFGEVLFPSGPPTDDAEAHRAFDLYKLMVESSEGLVGRRQAVNSFFLTMNGALLTASGIIVQGSSGSRLGGVGVAVLSIAGAILCLTWKSLITSFGQLNRGKFRVINEMERHLKAAVYSAEWEALGRGEDPRVYRSFTSREIWVPVALFWLHVIAAAVAIALATELFHFGGSASAAA